MMLQIADRFFTQAKGTVKDVIVKFDNFISTVDFVIMDMDINVDVHVAW